MQACQPAWPAGLDPSGVGLRWREARLARLIEEVRRGSPLGARRAGKARRIEDFDPVGKAELMVRFDGWATDRRITRRAAENQPRSASPGDTWLGQYLLWTSSGSSGEPGLFVQDLPSLAAYDALDALRLRPGTSLGEALWRWGLGRVLSVLGPMAEGQTASRTCNPTCSSPTPAVRSPRPSRHDGPRAFARPLRNSYGASKLLSIAFECSAGRIGRVWTESSECSAG